MYIAVCDDQTEELKDLTELLGAWETDRGTPVRVKSFRSAAELLDAARHERFTLYLLDIMMPGLNGMDAAREIRGFDKAADIIFLTSSPGFAYDSYSVQALEYLLKPIRAKTLYPILDRLELRERRPQEALTLRTGGIIVRVPFFAAHLCGGQRQAPLLQPCRRAGARGRRLDEGIRGYPACAAGVYAHPPLLHRQYAADRGAFAHRAPHFFGARAAGLTPVIPPASKGLYEAAVRAEGGVRRCPY